jgi:hypothetical protein
MKTTIFILESNKGFLKDIEEYTSDILEAVSFTNFEFACQKLIQVHHLLKNECWVSTQQIPFPRPKPFRIYILNTK